MASLPGSLRRRVAHSDSSPVSRCFSRIAWPLGRCRPPTLLAMGQNRQKTGKPCLLTPSVRPGRRTGMNESEKQFSFTRAASSTSRRAKNQISSALALNPTHQLLNLKYVFRDPFTLSDGRNGASQTVSRWAPSVAEWVNPRSCWSLESGCRQWNLSHVPPVTVPDQPWLQISWHSLHGVADGEIPA
jgi:hypothetical protein